MANFTNNLFCANEPVAFHFNDALSVSCVWTINTFFGTHTFCPSKLWQLDQALNDVFVYIYNHTWSRGGVLGGDAHRLTPQNIVPFPKAKFEPPNREKFSVATLFLSPKYRINIGRFFFHVLKGIFLPIVSCRHKKFLCAPSLPIPLISEIVPLPESFLVVPLP